MYIQTENIKKSYGEGGSLIQVLGGISTAISKGEMCVILGPSGSGKSTFLNILGGLDRVDRGKVIIDGKEISAMKQEALSDYRREYLGFVFQFYHLIPNLTVRENIEVCRYLSKDPLDLDELLDLLGIADQKDKFPPQLSGGQQQRCAMARALIKNPKLLLCDEPTGALDSKASKEILILLEKINKTYGTTMLIVTHNEAIKEMVHRVIRIRDGQIAQSYLNDHPIPAREVRW